MNHCRRMGMLLWLLIAGCGSNSTLVVVQGEVSYDGQSVERGQIDFVPVEKTPGAPTVGTIVSGRYQINAKGGLLPNGVYSVRIVAFRKTGMKAPNRFDPNGPAIEVEENYIPAIYNSDSTLKVRVAELQDKNKVDFQLGATAPPTGR